MRNFKSRMDKLESRYQKKCKTVIMAEDGYYTTDDGVKKPITELNSSDYLIINLVTA